MRAQCAFAVMMRMLMMITGMDELSCGEGGFPALPHETIRRASLFRKGGKRDSEEICILKMVTLGGAW